MLLYFAKDSFAQRTDFQTWWAAELEGEAFNLIDFEISPEIRLTRNSGAVRAIHADFDFSVPVTSFFKAGARYRIQKKNNLEDYSYIVNRFGLYGKFDTKINRLRLDYRFIYQWEYVGINSRVNGNMPYQEHRHKIAASYYRKRWNLRPQTSMELFFLHKPDFVLKEKKYRFTLGVNYKIDKNLFLDLDYKFQNEFFETNPLKSHLIAAKITFEL